MIVKRLLKSSLILLLLCLHHSLQAQELPRLITGRVINQDTKEPLRGVSVSIKGTSKGVVTNEEGVFSLPAPRQPETVTLNISYIGFGERDIRTKGDSALLITLSNSNKKMDDVIVVGYGTQKRSNILGSISTVNPKEVEDLPVANLSTALINMAPGVGVTQTSGKPGATTNVTIRGAFTLNSTGTTSPLYVIDGLAPIIGSGSSIDPTGKTAFDNLDPTQIESITFLKDAAATIYGARGANGVVLVTTKKGRPGKPRISYAGSYSNTQATKLPTMIDGYNQALLLNNWVENYPVNPAQVRTSEIYTPAELDTIKSRNFDWFRKEWIKNGNIQKHTLNISGGTEKLTYFAGANYYNEVGNLPEIVANNHGIQLGMTARIIEGLNTELTLNANQGYSNRPAPKGVTEQTDQLNGTVGALLMVPKWVPIYVDGGLPYYYPNIGWHPAALAASNSYAKDNSTNFALNAKITYAIPVVKGLSLTAQYGRNTLNDYTKQYYPPYNTYTLTSVGAHKAPGPTTNGATGTQNVIYNYSTATAKQITNGNQLTTQITNSDNWQATEGIAYSGHFGDHDISATVLSEQAQTTGNFLTTTVQSQVIPGIDQTYGFDVTGLTVVGQSISTGRVSYLGRLNYAFKGRYLLEGSFRDDASPNFPVNHQWGFFPSGSVGWKISEERFFEQHIRFLNDLKIRFNMGLTGNDANSAFGWAQRYTTANGYLFGGTQTNGLNITNVPNPDITWESALFKDLGLDGTFANRRFTFALDYWYKHQYNMLVLPTSTIPPVAGITSVTAENYGIANSWGTEAQLGYRQNLTKDLQIFATVNFSWSDNKIIKTYFNPGTDTGYLNPIGKRMDKGITGYKSTGIVRSAADAQAWNQKNPAWTVNGDTLRAGDLNFRDLNGDGYINSLDQTQIAKRSSTIMGFGFNFGAQWKGLRVSTNISLGLGGQIAWKKVDITPPTMNASALSMWKGSYTAYHTDAKLPAIYAPFANQASTFWLHSATYMYVNNLQISYMVPVSWTAAHHIPETRVYLTGFNLWTIINPTPYRDPRSNEITDYPILRNVTFGLNVAL